MASEQSWRDFRQITTLMEAVKTSAQQINNQVNRLKHDKAEIMDDAARLAEMKKIVDIHPLYTVTQLQAYYQKAVDLQAFLVDNGYIT